MTNKLILSKQAVAGTLESSDIQIIINQNNDKGIDIHLKSSVEKQYGNHIRQFIKEILLDLGIENAKLQAVDQGALDSTIRARTITALYRSAGITSDIDWEVLDR